MDWISQVQRLIIPIWISPIELSGLTPGCNYGFGFSSRLWRRNANNHTANIIHINPSKMITSQVLWGKSGIITVGGVSVGVVVDVGLGDGVLDGVRVRYSIVMETNGINVVVGDRVGVSVVVGVNVLVGVIVAVGRGVEERKGAFVLVTVLVMVGFGVFVGGSWLTWEEKISGKKTKSSGITWTGGLPAAGPDGIPSNNININKKDSRRNIFNVFPLSYIIPLQYYIDFGNLSTIDNGFMRTNRFPLT
jgi:hypothetical protein